MSHVPARYRHALAATLAMVALLAAALVAVASTSSAHRADAAPAAPVVQAAAAPAKGKIVGAIYAGGQLWNAPVKVTIFDLNWRQIGYTTVRSTYQISLTPGSYRVQITDTRPMYDTTRFRPFDIAQQVKSNQTVQRDAVMSRGASITGTAYANYQVAPRARVVAANQYGTSFETVANDKGQFAIGGLPNANYSIFTWDARRQWADNSLYLANRKAGQNTNITINLRRRAGSMSIDLRGGSTPLAGSGWVTATNRTTGQWYTAQARNGSVSFSGLMPGPYDLTVPDMGGWLGRTGPVPGGRHVPSGGVLFGAFQLLDRGASVTGTVVDSRTQSRVLPGVAVRLYDQYGTQVGSTTSAKNGTFRFDTSLRTSSGVKVVADADAVGGWIKWGTGGDDQCQYRSTTTAPFGVTQGVTSNVGPVALVAVGHAQNAKCIPPTSTGTPTATGTPTPTSTATSTATSTVTSTAKP